MLNPSIVKPVLNPITFSIIEKLSMLNPTITIGITQVHMNTDAILYFT